MQTPLAVPKDLQNPLARKLLVLVLLCSSIITLFISGIQVYLDFRKDMKVIENLMLQIQVSFVQSISLSVWHMELEQTNTLLNGILSLPNIEYLEIQSESGSIEFSVGKRPEEMYSTQEFSLEYKPDFEQINRLGRLVVIASLKEVYQDLWEKIIIILISQGIKTFIVSLFILFIVYYLITRHLWKMANFTRELNFNDLGTPLELDRLPDKQEGPDELEQVVQAINELRSRLGQRLKELNEEIKERRVTEEKLVIANEEVNSLNRSLELRVHERTRKLKEANEELKVTLQNLEKTQDQLIESEKMAALGELVTGIAHEVNTPLGICVTGVSFLGNRLDYLSTLYHEGEMKKDDFEEFLENSKNIHQSTITNLSRAADLIQSFKQIAVDRSAFDKRKFKVAQYIQMTLNTLQGELKHKHVSVEVICHPDLEIDTDAGVFSQIISTLISNSIMHAFDNVETGTITLKISENESETILQFSDNGIGIAPENLKKIFDPFYTTQRGRGGTGLGLHILYNLIHRKVGGTIYCQSELNEGATFTITFPKDDKTPEINQ